MAEVYTVNINTSQAVKSIASLEKELAETTEQLKQVEIGSDAFKELQAKAANAKSQIDKFNQETDVLSKGFKGFGENAAKVTAGITGGITAATAAMQMMGVENENVVAGIAKLQQLMAFSQGVAAMKDMAEGMRALGVATKAAAGPIGVVVGVITALVLIWKKWGDKLRADYPIIDKVATAIENLKNKLVGMNDAVDSAVNGADNLAKIEKELQDIDTEKRVKELNDEAKQTYELYQSELKRLDLEKQRLAILMQQTTDRETFAKYQQEGLAVLEKEKQINQEITNLFASRASYAQELPGAAEFTLGGSTESSTSSAMTAPGLEREEEEDNGWADKVTEAQNYYQELMQLQMSEQAAFDASQQTKLDSLKHYLNEGLISEQQYTNAVKKLSKEEKQFKMQMQQQAALNIADTLNSLASTMDSTNEKQFKAMKAMQISAATIQMLVGITTAMSGAFTTKTGPWDIALAVTQAAAIAASGAATIANIARQKYDSTSSSSSASSLSSSAASSTLVTPTQYSSAVEGASIESSIADTRVYVVESDISGTSKRVSVQETENRY